MVRLAASGRLGKLTVGPAVSEAVAAAYANHPDIQSAAIVHADGGDGWALLTADSEEHEIRVAYVSKAQEIRVQREQDFANRLAYAVARLIR